MYISNIKVTVKTLASGKHWYEAYSDSRKISFGVVDTFNFNIMTRTFTGTGIKLTGVINVEYLG